MMMEEATFGVLVFVLSLATTMGANAAEPSAATALIIATLFSVVVLFSVSLRPRPPPSSTTFTSTPAVKSQEVDEAKSIRDELVKVQGQLAKARGDAKRTVEDAKRTVEGRDTLVTALTAEIKTYKTAIDRTTLELRSAETRIVEQGVRIDEQAKGLADWNARAKGLRGDKDSNRREKEKLREAAVQTKHAREQALHDKDQALAAAAIAASEARAVQDQAKHMLEQQREEQQVLVLQREEQRRTLQQQQRTLHQQREEQQRTLQEQREEQQRTLQQETQEAVARVEAIAAAAVAEHGKYHSAAVAAEEDAARARDRAAKAETANWHAAQREKGLKEQLKKSKLKEQLEVPVWVCDVDGAQKVYDSKASDALERAYASGMSSLKLNYMGHLYDIDNLNAIDNPTAFSFATQKNCETHVKRKVLRTLVKRTSLDGQAAWTVPGTLLPGSDTTVYTLDARRQRDAGATRENQELQTVNSKLSWLWPAFDHSKVKTVYVYDSADARARYGTCKARFAAKGDATSKEEWVFHGTKTLENANGIVSKGFKIGGQNGHQIDNGAVYGQGVYTDQSPDTPTKYGKYVVLCKALTGTCSRAGVPKRPALQYTNDVDSWYPEVQPKWRIFKRAEQLLPLYVVQMH